MVLEKTSHEFRQFLRYFLPWVKHGAVIEGWFGLEGRMYQHWLRQAVFPPRQLMVGEFEVSESALQAKFIVQDPDRFAAFFKRLPIPDEQIWRHELLSKDETRLAVFARVLQNGVDRRMTWVAPTCSRKLFLTNLGLVERDHVRRDTITFSHISDLLALVLDPIDPANLTGESDS